MIRYLGIEFESVYDFITYRNHLHGKRIRRSNPKKRNPWKRWTAVDNDYLKEAIQIGKSHEEIARMLGRTESAVASRASNLKTKKQESTQKAEISSHHNKKLDSRSLFEHSRILFGISKNLLEMTERNRIEQKN